MDGFIIINKKENMTSRDVVNIVCKKLHTKKINNEIEIKQDSLTRIVVLYTKLGKKEDISEILGMKENEIESILNNALETGMIKNNELKGVNLLDAEIENKQLDFEEK